MTTSPLQLVVERIFTFPPIFKAASAAARAKIMKRGKEMGVWLELDTSVAWPPLVESATNPTVITPAYYKAPFHAYEQGNLSLEAALEVTNAAKSVHATVFQEPGGPETLDARGDERLRASFQEKTKDALKRFGIEPNSIQTIVDIGAATGLSSLALLEAYPNAVVRGIDLSPYFLAVGTYLNRELIESGRLSLEHAAAENLCAIPDESQSMVSMCLVCHELPTAATRKIFAQAFQKLKPGGVLCIMEMDPTTPAFQRVLSNPIPYTVFKSTEPYLLEYVALDMERELCDAGFGEVATANNSPRHKTVVALKR